MQVEIYEIEGWDVTPEVRAIEDVETKELIASLGLKGQERFINGETLERFPYRLMTKDEYFTYKVLFPEVSSYENFSGELIPLRVLRLLQFAKSELCPIKWEGIEIWSPESATIKDPVLVGKTKEDYTIKYWLLARWGSALEPLEKLKPIALRKALADYDAKLDAIRHELSTLSAKNFLSNPEKLLSRPVFYT